MSLPASTKFPAGIDFCNELVGFYVYCNMKLKNNDNYWILKISLKRDSDKLDYFILQELKCDGMRIITSFSELKYNSPLYTFNISMLKNKKFNEFFSKEKGQSNQLFCISKTSAQIDKVIAKSKYCDEILNRIKINSESARESYIYYISQFGRINKLKQS